jgi:hypothetical protein
MSTTDAAPIPEAATGDATRFAMEALGKVPKGDREVMEAHLTGMLIVFWAALWGSFGTEYARGFIEAQLRGMEADVPHDTFTPPRMQ